MSEVGLDHVGTGSWFEVPDVVFRNMERTEAHLPVVGAYLCMDVDGEGRRYGGEETSLSEVYPFLSEICEKTENHAVTWAFSRW